MQCVAMHHNWGFIFIVVVVVVVSLLFDCSFASHTLTLNQTLADGQILVSADKRFQLGFFSPGNSTKRYVGIWYTISPELVVWVANREKPVTGLSGYLRVSSGGQLAVLDQTHHVLWSSNSSKLVYDPVARILDNGNLIVEERSQVSSATYAWQSFDYPTDTALPGFVIGRDSSEDQDAFLSSWKSTEDPSPGGTVFRFDYSGTSQMVVEQGSTRKYRTGPWNGLRFSGLSFYSTPTVKPLVMIFDKNKLCGAYFLYNSSSAGRLVLGSTGVLSLYILDEGRSQWRFFHSLPTDPCDNYGQCGVNGFCSLAKQSLCDCLKGFTPKNPQTWAKLDFSAGCNRSVPLACGKGDGFLKLVGVKLPDMLKVWLNTSMSLQECGAKCLANCSCTAYANSNISGHGSGCLLWFGDLIDIREYHDKSSEQEMYLRLSASELRSVGSFRKKRLEMEITFPVVIGILILVSLCWSIFWRKQRTARGEDLLTFDFNVKQRTPEAADKTKRLIRANKDESELEIPVFNLSSVSACTDNFSTANKLGEGGFGPVYKGILLNGHEVAVKRLSVRSKQGWEELKNEAVLIAKLQHKNLVKLLGCCIEGEEHILIYEYLPNKSLDIFLFDTTKSAMLDWASRVHIIKGIAQGLLYLHEYSRLKIIHRDLKASNILLDEDMNPKISDFGLARIFGGVDEGATGRIVGTYGYMAPEYASHGIFSVKSDVFSFGVLMLEILSGKKNTGFHRSDYLNLLGYAWDLWTSKRALELKDPTLQDTNCVTTDSFFMRNVNIALLCVQEKAVARPTMSEVVSMISNEHSPLPCPKRPAFAILRNVVNPVSDSSTSDICSVNLVTSSTIQAR